MSNKTPPRNTSDGRGHAAGSRKSQWKKGQSGNPKGRPKAEAPELPELLDPTVEIVEKGKRRKIPAFEAHLTALAKGGIEGDKESDLIDLMDYFVEYGVIQPIPPQTEQTTIEVPEEIWPRVQAILVQIDEENAP